MLMLRVHRSVIGVVLLLTWSGCTLVAPRPIPATDEAPPLSSVRVGGRVVLGLTTDVAGLNPLVSADPQSTTVSDRIYESLTMPDPTSGEPRPRLAESWTVAADGTSLTFTLRDNLFWSDGSPLTIADVAFTFAALLRSQTSFIKGPILDEVVGAREYADGSTEAIGGVSTSGRSLTLQLTRPSCTALADLGAIPILPKSVFGKYLIAGDATASIDGAAENNAPPLASGPFQFKEWHPGDHVTLVRNDHFFLGPPQLDEWVYRVVPNASSLAAALKTGEVDVAQISPQVRDDLNSTGVVETFSIAGTGYTYIAWNELRGGKEFFGDSAVRQALSYGLNWDQILATQLSGNGQRVVSHTPPTSWAYDPTGLQPFAYDPQKARLILEQDGWRMGPDQIYQKDAQRLAFTLLTSAGSPLREAIVQIAAEQYRQIGVEATPRTEAFEALLQRTISSKDPTYGEQGGHDYDAIVIGWGQVGPDPDAYWYWDSSSILGGAGNRVGYRNQAVDQAIEDGRTHCQPIDRKAAYHQMDVQLNQDQPVSFGFVSNVLLAVNKHIQGVDPRPYSFLAQWNVEQWWRTP